ncbi:MAG: hypothetical protein ABGX68_00710 [Methylococcales bacterium]|nr:hypothetical protein [Methylococcaceae bacterium]
MNKNQLLKKSLLSVLGLLFSSVLWAHGGAAGTDTDQCKFELEPDHWIHYTAYQPNSYPGDEFCGNLPDIDTTTLLVFDYQDIRYRNMSVEFEVTKEPEGTVIFRKEAKKHKTGTVNLNIGGIAEASKYLIHITLLQDSGERLDAHMAFQAGSGKGSSSATYLLYFLVLLALLYIYYISDEGFKKKVDSYIKSSTSMKDD